MGHTHSLVFVETHEKKSVAWLNEEQFVPHMMTINGMGKNEAKAKWASSIDDRAVPKKGSGDDTTIPLKLPDVSVMIEGFRKSSELKQLDGRGLFLRGNYC